MIHTFPGHGEKPFILALQEKQQLVSPFHVNISHIISYQTRSPNLSDDPDIVSDIQTKKKL